MTQEELNDINKLLENCRGLDAENQGNGPLQGIPYQRVQDQQAVVQNGTWKGHHRGRD